MKMWFRNKRHSKFHFSFIYSKILMNFYSYEQELIINNSTEFQNFLYLKELFSNDKSALK